MSTFVTGNQFQTSLSAYKTYCINNYVRNNTGNTLTGDLKVTGTCIPSADGSRIYMGGNGTNDLEKRIYYNNTGTGTYDHNVYFYGGSADSTVAFGLYDVNKSKVMMRYRDQSTDKFVELYAPYSHNAITIYNGSATSGTFMTITTTDTKVPFNTTLTRPRGGSLLSLNSNGVKIGQYVNYVEVSGQLYVYDAIGASPLSITIRKNGTAVNYVCSDRYYSHKYNTFTIVPIIIPVTEGDIITMYVKTFSSSTSPAVNYHAQPKSWLTVTALG